MIKRSMVILVVVFIGMLSCNSAIATVVSFDLLDLGGDSFEYVYTIDNDTLQVPIEQFTIWFDEQLYNNLQVTTQIPLANDWSEIILPSTGFGVPLGYYALTLTSGIDLGQSIEGFSVSFDWLGTGLAGYQSFEIIDTLSSETIDAGYTVPEPTTLFLLACGAVAARFYRRDVKV